MIEAVPTRSPPMTSVDLHCHSTISDGLLTPQTLVQRAFDNGVQILALTDHDDCDGLEEAGQAAQPLGIRFINGVEISTNWRGKTLHIVGLGIDPSEQPIREGLAQVRGNRMARAEKMAVSLAKAGIGGSLEGALAYAGNPGLIGRTHFARFLVANGHARDVQSVFRRFLVRGKPGYVEHEWASLENAVAWIVGSGGRAVIAHPGRYDLSKTALLELMREFKSLGGTGLEVVTSSHTIEQEILFAGHAKNFEFLSSKGSDYHGPGESRVELGRVRPLPDGCIPIWEALQ